MKATRIDEYHKNGHNFFGKLAVVNYLEEMKKDTKFGSAGLELSDYLIKSKAFMDNAYGNKYEVLLETPELVIKILE